jgi:hypothetical protein
MSMQMEQRRVPFRERVSVDIRRAECERVQLCRPTHVPTILVCSGTSTPQCEREKFLLGNDVCVAQLSTIVRSYVKLQKHDALFFLCDNTMLIGSDTMRELQHKYKDAHDGFLYISYAVESAFGSTRLRCRQCD